MNLFIKIAYNIQKIIWKILKPQTLGIRAIVIKEKQVLLVKPSYHKNWFLPGGGLKKSESFLQGIERELKEELGLTAKNYELFGVYENFFEGKKDRIVVFIVRDFELHFSENFEIEKHQFFDLKNLPKEISPGTKRRITEYLEERNSHYGKW